MAYAWQKLYFVKPMETPINYTRVLHVLFDDRLGGAQRRIISSARGLKDQQIETQIVFPDRGGRAVEIARREGIQIHLINIRKIPRPKNPIQILKWIIAFPFEVFKFSCLYKNTNPDVVNVSGAFFLAPGVAARMQNIPVVWHLNDTSIHKFVAPAFGRIVLYLAQAIVAQGYSVATHYGLKNENYHCFYSGVDNNKFSPSKASSNVLRRKFHIGMLANWNPIKGLDIFVSAAHIVNAQQKDVTFVIAGPKLDTQKVYAKLIEDKITAYSLEDNISCFPFVEDVPEYMRELDLFILPSLVEACPNVVLEAMSSGIAVVAADVGSVRDLLGVGSNKPAGIIFPPGDSNVLATQMLKLTKDPDIISSLGDSGRERAVNLFSLDTYVENHANLYKSLVNK